MSYKHLTERGLLLIHLMQGMSLCKIAKLLGRNKSTISRELARNKSEYLPSKAGVVRVGQKIIPQQTLIARTNCQSSQARKLPDSDKLQDNISGNLRGDVRHAGTKTFHR